MNYIIEEIKCGIAEELNRPLEDIDNALDNGYWCLKHIVMDNYLNKEE